jgi:hypothetical protein
MALIEQASPPSDERTNHVPDIAAKAAQATARPAGDEVENIRIN